MKLHRISNVLISYTDIRYDMNIQYLYYILLTCHVPDRDIHQCHCLRLTWTLSDNLTWQKFQFQVDPKLPWHVCRPTWRDCPHVFRVSLSACQCYQQSGAVGAGLQLTSESAALISNQDIKYWSSSIMMPILNLNNRDINIRVWYNVGYNHDVG